MQKAKSLPDKIMKIRTFSTFISWTNEKEEKTDFQALFFKYIIHWPWFVASVLICTGLAFAYLRYQIPVYEVSSSILIKEDDKKSTNNALSAMQDFGMLSMTSNFDNELEIL